MGQIKSYNKGCASRYRYGFNGKEKDTDGEWGSTTHYDYGFRIYNPAIARFLSVDPLTQSYPNLTPYQFAHNSPIVAIDIDGLEGLVSVDYATLEELKKSIAIVYNNKDTERASVTLSANHKGVGVTKTLSPGYRESELRTINDQLKSADRWEKAKIVVDNPTLVLRKNALKGALALGKTKSNISGTANYYIAKAMVGNITSNISKAYKGDKGLVNTFNHITGQAVMSMIFGANSSDFVADIHERGQPELMTGNIKSGKPTAQAIDNYVDLINNQFGQILGEELAGKYKSSLHFGFTPETTASLLNDFQSYFGDTFNKDFKEFSENDDLVRRFSNLLNEVNKGREHAKASKFHKKSDSKQ